MTTKQLHADEYTPREMVDLGRWKLVEPTTPVNEHGIKIVSWRVQGQATRVYQVVLTRRDEEAGLFLSMDAAKGCRNGIFAERAAKLYQATEPKG
jgi:hypothetical protein